MRYRVVAEMDFSELVHKAVRKDREKNNNEDIQCEHCGCTNTPLWRSGPSGPKSLCNACGLRWTKGTLKIVPKGGVYVAPKSRDPSLGGSPKERKIDKAARVAQRNQHRILVEPTVEADELSKRRNMMIMHETRALKEADQPSLMLRPQPMEMTIDRDPHPAQMHRHSWPMASDAMHSWENGSFFEDFRIAASPYSPEMAMECLIGDLPTSPMDATDISGLLDSMDEAIPVC